MNVFFSCPTLYKALMGATQGCSIEWQKPVTKKTASINYKPFTIHPYS